MLNPDTMSPKHSGFDRPVGSCISSAMIHQISPTSTSKNPAFVQTADTPNLAEHDDQRGAALLLSVAALVTKEIDKDGINWEDDIENFPVLPSMDSDSDTEQTREPTSGSTVVSTRYNTKEPLLSSSVLSLWNRIRTVSIDVSEDLATYRGEKKKKKKAASDAVVLPNATSVERRFPVRKAAMSHKQKSSPLKLNTPRSHKRTLLPPKSAPACQSLKTILRKKFSWKNFPELEAFLIANREEYLRHSALNYTIQQKQYNNTLTERLLELAVEHGYVFDEDAFSFVTVRDRIRCYFKSYVQSAKKRGLIIGYAAKKAGLLSEED